MKRIDSITKSWSDYELLDSGDNRRLERFGNLILDRPDPQALWSKSTPALWQEAVAQFARGEKSEHGAQNAKWTREKGIPDTWNFHFDTITLELACGAFKHIGVFPEHAEQWGSIAKKCDEYPNLKVLNLFGYTGACSIVAAAHGADVTHVDASKQTIATLKRNIALSGLPADAIRVITEDALKYAKRLILREEQFDIIVMDPPAFGRGPKGEVWKIEEKLPELLSLIPKLLTPTAKLVFLNGYAAGFSARSFGELLASAMKDRGEVFYGDVGIQHTTGTRVLSTGIYAGWKQ